MRVVELKLRRESQTCMKRNPSLSVMLKPCCSECGSTTDLCGSNCKKHITLCGKTMPQKKVAQYKQFTLEEAEEEMKARKKASAYYERLARKLLKGGDDDDDDEEDGPRGAHCDLDDDYDEYCLREGDSDLDDHDDHFQGSDDDLDIFTDDDEAVGLGPEDREHFAPRPRGYLKMLLKSTLESLKRKRKLNEETQACNAAPPPKKDKTENEPELSVKDENGSAAKSNAPPLKQN